MTSRDLPAGGGRGSEDGRHAGDGSESGARTPSSDGSAARDPYSLVQLLSVLLRHRRWVVGIPLVLTTLVVAYLLVVPRSHLAEASFTPQAGERPTSRFAGLAAEFGVDLGAGGASESPQFYASLLKSREILETVAMDRYLTKDGDDRASLLDLYRLRGDTERERLRQAVKRLRRDVAVRVGRETGIVEFSVKSPEPYLAEAIARRLLDLVNEFDLERRQSSARAEGEFVEGRLADAHEELRIAEDSLESFLRQNRRYENSPELVFQHDRLQRAVAMRQQLYTSLLQSHERARIDQVRNTPVITVVETPEGSSAPAPRGLVRRALLAFVLGGVAGVLVAFSRDALTEPRTSPDRDELRALWAETRRDATRTWRRTREAVKLPRSDGG